MNMDADERQAHANTVCLSNGSRDLPRRDFVRVGGGCIRVAQYAKGRNRNRKPLLNIQVARRRFRIRSGLDGEPFETIEQARSCMEEIVEKVESGERSFLGAVEPYLPNSRRAIAALSKNASVQAKWQENAKSQMLCGARRRSEKLGIPFNITREDLFIPEKCPVLGIPLVPSTRGNGFAERDNSPSIDRIDPSNGYVSGNVVVISWRANRIKGNFCSDDLQRVADWLRFLEHLPEKTGTDP